MVHSAWVTVYAGSRPGIQSEYAEAAYSLGKQLALAGRTVVFGGSSVGLMGPLADGVRDHGGRLIGVMPREFASVQPRHPALADLRLVEDTSARNAVMLSVASARIVLPGGLSLLEELMTAMGAGRVVLLNTLAFFDALVAMLRHSESEGFVPVGTADRLHVCRTPQEAVATLEDGVG